MNNLLTVNHFLLLPKDPTSIYKEEIQETFQQHPNIQT